MAECISYCNGFCGLDYDEDDPETWPSSVDDEGLCLDDGQPDGHCDEFYSEEEETE